MSNYNVPSPAVSTNDPSIPPIETNYVVRHDPVAVATHPPPPSTPQLPLPVVPGHVAHTLGTQPRKPQPPHIQTPRYNFSPQQQQQQQQEPTKLPKLIPTQQHRPVAQYNRPRILARGPANGAQTQVRQFKSVTLGSPSHDPSSPASPIPVPVSNSGETTDGTTELVAEPKPVVTSIPDTSTSCSMSLESIFMATVGTSSSSSVGNKNQTETTFGNQVFCQQNSTVQPTTKPGIQLNYLPVVDNAQQIQFPMSDIGVFQLIGLPMSMPETTVVPSGSNLIGVSEGLQPQLISQNSYSMGLNEEQQQADAISMTETESAIQGLEEYLMASSSSSSGNGTDTLSMTGQMSSATTAGEVAEGMNDFDEPSVMTFEDFSDLIRGLPMDPNNIMPDTTLDQAQSPDFQDSQSFPSNPMDDGSIPIEEMDTQPLCVLNDRDGNLETMSENQQQQLSLAPAIEPRIPIFEPSSEDMESIPSEPAMQTNESSAMEAATESISEIQSSIQLYADSTSEIPIIEKSSEESPLVSEAVAPDSGIDLCPPAIDTETSEAKSEPEVIPCQGTSEAKDRETETPSEIILDEKPQENGLEKEAVAEAVVNGNTEYEDVKLEADEELESSTTEMSPTDSAPDSDSEKLVIVESKEEEEEAKSVESVKPEENVKPVVNGVKTENHVDGSATSSRTYTTIDPGLFSDPSTKLIWENGIGTFPGTGLKFRVNPVTGVLETCESSLIYLRSIKQDENKPLKKPMLNSPKGKNKFLPLAMTKAKNNPIIGMARTQTNKNQCKKQTGATKKKSTNSEAGERETSKEDLNVLKIKAEPKNEEEEGESTLTADEIEDSGVDSPEKKTTSCSSKKTTPTSGTVSTGKPKNKPGRKPSKLNPSPVPIKVEESEPEPSKLVFAKKSAPIPVLPVLPEQVAEMASFTVVPILQSSPVGSPEVAESEDEPEEVTKVERQRRGRPPKVPMVPKGKKLKKRRKKVTVEQKLKMKQAANKELRKRNFEKVLSTRTQHYNNAAQAADSVANTTGTESYASSGNEELAPAPSPQSSSSGKEKTGLVMSEFVWTKYLVETNSKGAPPRLFRQPAFPPPNPFKAGMMLEAIDPQHQSLCCVASISEVQGYRLRINITGYSYSYDFWVNADSYEIFPAGWCEENGHTLEAPPRAEQPFNWHKYLIDEQLIAADRNFFAISKEDPVMNSDFLVGMKLEAVDIRNQSLICVATIAQVINERFLVHFDSWDSVYDYWTDNTSPFIHPVGWCSKNGAHLTPPNTCKTDFTWEKYLQETKSIPMPSHLFRPLPPIKFMKGMKLECVDKRNPYLIRVATIVEVEEHQLTIHFDHWPTIYDYQVYECSPDIHPVGWCSSSGHALQPPPPNCTASKPWNGACTTYGCLGLGHVKGPKFLTHNIPAYCPYAPANLKKELLDFVQDRVITFEQNLSMFDSKPDSSGLSPLKTREKRKLEHEVKSEKGQQQRKSCTHEVPAKIAKRKLTGRKSDSVLPSSSESSLRESTEEMTITSEPIQDSALTIDKLPMIRKYVPMQTFYGRRASSPLDVLPPPEKDKLTIESVPTPEDQQQSNRKYVPIQTYYGRRVGDFSDLSPLEKDLLTIESVSGPEDQQEASTTSVQATSSKEALALLRKNLALKRKSEKLTSPKPKRHYTPRGAKAKATPLHVGPVQPEKSATTTGLILPKIESTITACPPPGLTPAPGAHRTYHTWDETIDSVVRACLRKGSSEEGQSTAEFQLPPSTTMTPINVPPIQPLSIQTQDMTPKQDNSLLLMMIPTQAGGAATTHTVSSSLAAMPVPVDTVTSAEPGAKPRSRAGSTCEDVRARKSSQISPYQSPLSTHGEQDSDLPFNYALNIQPFQVIVGNLCQDEVAKWMTKDVADFVARIPGCISAGKRFTEQMIDGEAFLLMTQNDLLSIMGLKMGHSLKVAHAIRLIHSNSNGPPAFVF